MLKGMHATCENAVDLWLVCMLLQRTGACTHWLSVVTMEMQRADTAKYRTSVLAFINALLHGLEDVVERCRVREQLLAAGETEPPATPDVDLFAMPRP